MSDNKFVAQQYYRKQKNIVGSRELFALVARFELPPRVYQ